MWLPDSDCGAPRLGGALAHVSCTPWQTYDGGDHVLYLGEVQEFRIHSGHPLLFHTGKFHHLGDDHEPVLWGDSADGPEGQASGPPHRCPAEPDHEPHHPLPSSSDRRRSRR